MRFGILLLILATSSINSASAIEQDHLEKCLSKHTARECGCLINAKALSEFIGNLQINLEEQNENLQMLSEVTTDQRIAPILRGTELKNMATQSGDAKRFATALIENYCSD